MKYLAVCVAVIALVAFTSAGAEEVTPQQLQAELDKAVAQGVPGVSAAIATRDGVIWTGAAGFADIKAKAGSV